LKPVHPGGTFPERENGLGEVELPLQQEVLVSAIGVLLSDHPKCLDLIFMYLSGLMISIGSLRLMNHAFVVDK
jgi:hypothetical protein